MTEPAPAGDEYDVKQCGRCAAWIPRTATMCAYCGTTSPDSRIDPRPARTPLGLPRGVTVTRILIAVNCLYFLFSIWAQLQWDPGTKLARALIEGRGFNFGLDAAGAYLHGSVVAGEWWRVLACTFLHAGLLHLGMNMYALNQLGHIAEEVFGGAKLLAIYLICGASSAFAITVYYVWMLGAPLHQVPSLVGASGAIFGVGGLLASFLLKQGTIHGRRVGWQITQNLVAMLLIGFLIPRISNTGHVGGMIPGALFGLVVREQFSTLVSPTARRNWWLVATLASVAAAVAIAHGVNLTLSELGGPR